MHLFHKIVYKTIPVNIPDYLTLYSGDSRLRRTHLDNLSFVSNIASTTTSINNLNKSFFFRTHTLWNSLPFDIRNLMRLTQFKSKLAKHFWSIVLVGPDNEQPEHEWSFQSSGHQMKGSAKFLERVLQILVWGSGGHLVLNRYTYLI